MDELGTNINFSDNENDDSDVEISLAWVYVNNKYLVSFKFETNNNKGVFLN